MLFFIKLRVERGELTLRAAGVEMGISDARAGQLLAARRAPEPEALVVRAAMNTKLASPNGTACYAQRKTTIEPIFGTSK